MTGREFEPILKFNQGVGAEFIQEVMVIYRDLNLICRNLVQPVVTIGNFDGVHRGHQQLFRLVKERARARGGQAVVVTFDPHPIKIMQPQRHLPLLTTTEQKLRFLSHLELDVVIVHPFSREFGAQPAQDFVRHYLVERLGVVEVIIGHDYRFGRNREGDIKLLRELGALYGFQVQVVAAIKIEDTVVSSTLIRNLIKAGEVARAQVFLGRPYEVTGEVVHGYGRGSRLLGYPTANLKVDNELLPAAGIYAVRAYLDDRSYDAVANIGVCPTFGDQELTLEVHLLDFQGDIYGRRLAVEFVARLREERRFPDVAALVAQIEQDVAAARQIL